MAHLRADGWPDRSIGTPVGCQNHSVVRALDNPAFLTAVVVVALGALAAVIWSRRG